MDLTGLLKAELGSINTTFRHDEAVEYAHPTPAPRGGVRVASSLDQLVHLCGSVRYQGDIAGLRVVCDKYHSLGLELLL